MNNFAEILGVPIDTPTFSHSIYGENFFTFSLESLRLSGRADIIPCMIPEFLAEKVDLTKEQVFSGHIRSYNKIIDGVNRLDVRLFVKNISVKTEIPSLNHIELTGYLCKQPIYRKTPFGREITDMLVAVNRAFNKSDYIPVICWGKNARMARELSVGNKIYLNGRLQSREYEKTMENDVKIKRTAYEVSVSELEKLEE